MSAFLRGEDGRNRSGMKDGDAKSKLIRIERCGLAAGIVGQKGFNQTFELGLVFGG